MPLSCNIDARGKLARLIYGLVMMFAGAALIAFWAWSSGEVWRWVISIGCLAAGAFGVFEARAGWCVVRAMGFKTPM